MPGEDEELEQNYRRMINSKKITEYLSECYGYTGGMGDADAGSLLGRAYVTAYPDELDGIILSGTGALLGTEPQLLLYLQGIEKVKGSRFRPPLTDKAMFGKYGIYNTKAGRDGGGWLNRDALHTFFSSWEQDQMIPSCSANSYIRERLWIPSVADLKKYVGLSVNSFNFTVLSGEFLRTRSVDHPYGESDPCWWLDESGTSSGCAYVISGSVKTEGASVRTKNIGVRPMMWIKL